MGVVGEWKANKFCKQPNQGKASKKIRVLKNRGTSQGAKDIDKTQKIPKSSTIPATSLGSTHKSQNPL
jgi:hypothetical protein